MSEPVRLTLVGATGLVGTETIAAAVGAARYRLNAVTRREIDFPRGARMEAVLADPADWPAAIAATAPQAFACALGTTWRQSGKSEDAFRAVDERLVLESARAARAAGATRAVVVSSIGADRHSKNFYLRVKGEVEKALGEIGFERLDILRPGLLKGARGGDRRVMERLGIVASPLTNLLLHGKYRQYRAIPARMVAEAMLQLAGETARGRQIHDNDGIRREALRFRRKAASPAIDRVGPHGQ
jgi:uncharacterized protein YbjT (DUF2867 family)